eukprot:scaffold12020_cov122-Isochrysis_galbana.AAC.10
MWKSGSKPPERISAQCRYDARGYRGLRWAGAVVVHAALKPSLRKRRPEEAEGMGEEWEWEGGGGVSGRHGTEVSRRVAASV